MKKAHLVLLAALVCQGASAFGQKPVSVHNGTWWKDKSTSYKEGFVIGYRDGVGHTSKDKASSELRAGSSGQLVDGLNTFYSDFRNRNIFVSEALSYVIDQVRGTPDDKLALELQDLRKAALARGEE